MASRYADCVVEEILVDGPTGRFFEVARLQVRDYGNNVHWEGTPAEYAANPFRLRGIPTRLVAVAVAGEASEGLVGKLACDFADVA
jgi:hypothetical protein